MLESVSQLDGRKVRVECYLRRGDGLGNRRILRGVVFTMKSKGPRTEPWGTVQEEVYQKERLFSHSHENNEMKDKMT